MRRGRAEWARVIEEFERSGQSHETFCAQYRLNVGSFRSWLYRLRRSAGRGKVAGSATRLLPVRVDPADGVTVEPAAIEILVGSARLRVPDRVDPHFVAALVMALAPRC
jgi:hypothetical protein